MGRAHDQMKVPLRITQQITLRNQKANSKYPSLVDSLIWFSNLQGSKCHDFTLSGYWSRVLDLSCSVSVSLCFSKQLLNIRKGKIYRSLDKDNFSGDHCYQNQKYMILKLVQSLQ